ncbi:hypothetical protein KKF61_02725 [Patescibacteria group bacterium]|nr:hypothetical protein [Patescibacteria group bacterium]
MAKTMTPSMTDGQIDKVVENITAGFRKRLRDHRDELSSDTVQTVLGQKDFISALFAEFRQRVEAVSNMIVRKVKVDRTRTSQEALDVTGRKQYTDDDVVKSMPNGKGDETEVIFFKVGRTISDDDLEKEYELRGLVPADPYSLCAVNGNDPAFADEHPNGTHWKDSNGKWCFASFDRWSDERGVSVGRSDSGWYVRCWFAGVRKN